MSNKSDRRNFRMGGVAREQVTVPDAPVSAEPVSDVVLATVEEKLTASLAGLDGMIAKPDADANPVSAEVASVSDVAAIIGASGADVDTLDQHPLLRGQDEGMGLMLPVDGEHDAPPVAHVSADVADAFGMGGLVETGLVVIELVNEPVAAPVSVFGALVAAHKPIVADSVVRVELPAMLGADARAIAQRIADLTGVAVDVVEPGGTVSVGPRVRGSSVVRAAPRVASVSAIEPKPAKPERDWLTYDAREVCKGGNASNIAVWQKITDYAAAGDLDAMLAMNFAGARDELTGNTYTKNNGRYLRAWIAELQRRIAERQRNYEAAEAAMYAVAAD